MQVASWLDFEQNNRDRLLPVTRKQVIPLKIHVKKYKLCTLWWTSELAASKIRLKTCLLATCSSVSPSYVTLCILEFSNDFCQKTSNLQLATCTTVSPALGKQKKAKSEHLKSSTML